MRMATSKPIAAIVKIVPNATVDPSKKLSGIVLFFHKVINILLVSSQKWTKYYIRAIF